jgi:thiamine pyrophosphate-dependent acetolactate synthase large subunit-like protein
VRAETLDAVRTAFTTALAAGAPTLIEIIVDREV